MGQGVKWAATLYLWLNGESFPPWSAQAPSPQWTWHARRHSSMDTSITSKSSLRYIVYLWSKKGQHLKWFSTVFDRFDCDFQSLRFHFLTTEKPQLRLLWISWDFLGLKEECCLFTGPFNPFLQQYLCSRGIFISKKNCHYGQILKKQEIFCSWIRLSEGLWLRVCFF